MKRAVGRVLPEQLDVGDEAGDDDEVDLALAKSSVGDAEIPDLA